MAYALQHLINGDALVTNEFWPITGAAGEGTLMTFSSDPRRIATTLRSGGPWQSVLGPISFTPKSDPTVPDYVFHRWSNGSYAEIS